MTPLFRGFLRPPLTRYMTARSGSHEQPGGRNSLAV